MNRLFDKQIKIYLYDKSGGIGDPTDIITIPETGIKPNIGINATFITADVVQKVVIKMTNFYPSKGLSDYKYFRCLAGYKDDSEWAGFEGDVWVAFKDSPSPDGVTTFLCETCNMVDVLNTKINLHIDKGEYIDYLFNQIIKAMSDYTGSDWTLENSLEDIILSTRIDYIGTVKDFMAKLKSQYKLVYTFDGSKLVVYPLGGSRSKTDIIEIEHLSGVPTKSASGITFTCPWIPRLKPGMRVKINPKYFNISFGATQVSIGNVLTTQTVDIEYNTVTSQNKMTILALDV